MTQLTLTIEDIQIVATPTKEANSWLLDLLDTFSNERHTTHCSALELASLAFLSLYNESCDTDPEIVKYHYSVIDTLLATIPDEVRPVP